MNEWMNVYLHSKEESISKEENKLTEMVSESSDILFLPWVQINLAKDGGGGYHGMIGVNKSTQLLPDDVPNIDAELPNHA